MAENHSEELKSQQHSSHRYSSHRCLAFINQKGGVGKTTLAINCAAGYVQMGYRVLLVDLDPQAHLTTSLIDSSSVDSSQAASLERISEFTIEAALRREKSIEECIFEVPEEGFSLVPSDINLSAAENDLYQELGRELLLKDALAKLPKDRFDLIILDCPPSLGLLSLNALVAADDVIVPVQAEYLALQGMVHLREVVSLVQQRLHPQLSCRVVVPTMVDLRTRLSREVIDSLREIYSDEVTNTVIHSRVKVAEAPSFGMSIFNYDRKGPAAQEIANLCQEIVEKLGIEAPALELG
ncbi:MAG: hypothetical protein CBC13_08675 [Planctomycetia bacterium TMED53]|nr:MAG: hypothetical protein CBC13_08675 [Planctomycetia bacterium TMED53]